MAETDYERKVQEQIDQYIDLNIHELPEIFHYWSNRYLVSMLETVFGESDLFEIFANEISAAFARCTDNSVVSLGAGDCYFEIELASRLRKRGVTDFKITCIELSEHLTDRARSSAKDNGVEEYIELVNADINIWRPSHRVAAYMANQSLHHFVELELIFDNIKENLENEGLFITSDVIGRNGHQRWPEARRYLDKFWARLAPKYKYNHSLKRLDHPQFVDHDCSTEGFEGIRAEDIMPLLVKNFNFRSLVARGGIIEPFIDRGYGHNFDPANPEDVRFIDEVEITNSVLLQEGIIKPTQIVAAMTPDPNVKPKYLGNLSPQFCVRPEDFA